MADDSSEKQIIEGYFHQGYENDVILEFLSVSHNITISLSTLKRRLRAYGLRRVRNEVNEQEVKDIITREVNNGCGSLGYRAIWHLLRLEYHLHVPRHLVARIAKEVDPYGVQLRKRRKFTRRRYLNYGPNFCWHADGYDKLKPYGFPVHGAIDGYSRKILWLELSRSNNKPEIPARYYLDSVKRNAGCPILLRTDCGTENGVMAAMQCYFRQDGIDEFSGEKAHRYGSSPANQRIEGWWSFFRRGRAGWWIDFFKDMAESGVLDIGNTLHMECLWFCFESVLQDELEKVKDHWNSHRIRPSRNATVSGVPDVLYYLPQLSGGIECLYIVQRQQVDEMEPHIQYENPDETNVYQEYFYYVMDSAQLVFPTNAAEAYELFQKLIDYVLHFEFNVRSCKYSYWKRISHIHCFLDTSLYLS